MNNAIDEIENTLEGTNSRIMEKEDRISQVEDTIIQKGQPKHSNIKKMKRQKNTLQVKEQDKCPPNQTKEEEIENLPDKEF